MFVRRVTAAVASLFALLFIQLAPAWADDATYPPAVQGRGTTGVGGVKAGESGLQGTGSGGLAHTGFDGTVLWAAIAILVLGVALIVASRRRMATR